MRLIVFVRSFMTWKINYITDCALQKKLHNEYIQEKETGSATLAILIHSREARVIVLISTVHKSVYENFIRERLFNKF